MTQAIVLMVIYLQAGFGCDGCPPVLRKWSTARCIQWKPILILSPYRRLFLTTSFHIIPKIKQWSILHFASDFIKNMTICVFRVLIPHHSSLAKKSSFKSWIVMSKKCEKELKPNGRCNKPTILQFQSILTQIFLCSTSTTTNLRGWP